MVSRAREIGVTAAMCIITAGDEAEIARVPAVASAWDELRFSAGIHPHVAGDYAGRLDLVEQTVRGAVARIPRCRAIGEIGLDYHYDLSPRDGQREVFRLQVALARELRLPVVIHTREAEDDTFEVLRSEGRGEVPGIFHCFTGGPDAARRALDLGFMLSFAGIVTFPRASDLGDAARIVPNDRLLAETDSPYLAPVPYRGKRNEPAFVSRVYDVLAEIRATERTRVVEQITTNLYDMVR